MNEYTLGITGDGAGILKDGQPMTPEQIVAELKKPMMMVVPGNADSIELISDEIDDLISELASMTEAWQKNRERKIPSPILRRAIINASCELWDAVQLAEDS